MEQLQIDAAVLACEHPAQMRELQQGCAACKNRPACVRDLARALDDAGWDRWNAYCPNSATLAAVGAAQNCGWAGQYLAPAPHGPAAIRR